MTIFDLFCYLDEAQVLEVRRAELALLDPVHVALQSRVTYSGQRRKVTCPDGVISVTVPDPPPRTPASTRESMQRIEGMAALLALGAKPDDLVIFGDVDEIPTVDAVGRALAMPGLTAIRMPYHQLLARWRLPLERDVWHHRYPLVGTLGCFQAEGGFGAVREREHHYPAVEGGWHLSSMGGPLALRKFASFAHHDEPWRQGLTLGRLRALARAGRDVAGRFDMDVCPLRELPQTIQDDPDRYRALLEVCW